MTNSETTMMTIELIDLDDPAAFDTARCGHKAAVLATLKAAGFPAHAGVVIPADALPEMRTGDPPTPLLRAAAAEVIQRLGDMPLAVRSSGLAEDLAGASFAGAYVTVLGVEGVDATAEAIGECIDARHLARVSAYAGGEVPPIAVLLQPMIGAEAAGVAFTADPVTGDRDTIRVSAVEGLGDELAAGVASPEEWDVREGVAERRPESATAAIDAEIAAAVAALAGRVADHYGVPQDIEWAHDGTDVILLQARPITALPVPPEDTLPGGGWEKDVAHFPEPVSPFGSSLYQRATEASLGAACQDFGLLIDGMDVNVVGGEMYVRPIPAIGPREPKGPNPPAWLLGLLSRVLPALRRKARVAEAALANNGLESIAERWEPEWRPEMVAEINRLLEVDLTALDDTGLVAHAHECVSCLLRGVYIHFQLFMPYLVSLHDLALESERLLGWDAGQMARLLVGHSPASVAGRRELAEIGGRIGPESRAALEARPADPVAALGEIDRAVADELSLWLDAHGWRSCNSDPGAPTLRERPGLVSRLLLDTPTVPDIGTSADAEEEARSQLDGPDLARFDASLSWARRCYPLREDNVVLTADIPFGLLRRWLVEAGRRLVERGVIARFDDAPYLEMEEISAALIGDTSCDVTAVVARRRGEYAWTRAHPGPLHVGAVSAPPDMSKVPGALGRVNRALMWGMEQEWPSEAPAALAHALAGTPGSPGTFTGPVRIIRGEPDFQRLMPGDVLVCQVTTPAWSPLFSLAGALITDGGGVLSHAAIVAREHGLPAVLGTRRATSELQDGQIVTVDGSNGTVRFD